MKTLLKVVLALLVLSAAVVYWLLHGSLAQLDGQLTVTGLSQSVSVDRDAQGIVTIRAASRLDAAHALGVVHAQERYFQMDLLRRAAAGELSALLGSSTLTHDRNVRIHRFRARAEQAFQHLPVNHQAILQAYAEGVNQGLNALAKRPFEYFLLGQTPQPWQTSDSLLVIYSMYLQLQQSDGAYERGLTQLYQQYPTAVADFLTPLGSRWDAAIDGSQLAQRGDTAAIPELPRQAGGGAGAAAFAPVQFPGSNNWAVAGALTPYRAGMLANDMHLGIRVPNTWFHTIIETRSPALRLAGVSLPGTPGIIVGSNGHIAWGFTNSYGDWSDVIALKTRHDNSEYLTPSGWKPILTRQEAIEVANADAETITIRETQWGPILPAEKTATPNKLYAYRWVAHDLAGINTRIFDLTQAATVNDALQVAAGAGMPAQNLVVSDSNGDIGWTIMGAIPRRQGFSGRLVSDWSDGSQSWQGYYGETEHPRIIQPRSGRLWTANSRVVAGEAFSKIGNGGHALGARAQQIRDLLAQQEQFTETDMLAIQRNAEARFLQRWQAYLVSLLEQQESLSEQQQQLLQLVNNWQAEASVDSQGYALVKLFRQQTLKLLFADFDDNIIRAVRSILEVPAWQILQQQPRSWLPNGVADWHQFQQRTITATLAQVDTETLADYRWGHVNQAHFAHPLSAALGPLSRWLNMPQQALPGDTFMPFVQGSDFGASERLVVAPGHEQNGILSMPTGQSGHPLSPYYRSHHQDWLEGRATPLLGGDSQHQLRLVPGNGDAQ
ncbi:penicillin acylase family protein [Idiomarina xiamenensis]|uniref:Penicillin amidase n=1 Tax=Idiomarina xiamenensis 10-D-4 TaxID=740709 RepID=K2KFP4_9GAMM|nr:penicillin acylase family protein [Idiomarina xiamenensis]EKE81484.1 penicillin amidase [Idiomarina xiamenensis 10-D-4]